MEVSKDKLATWLSDFFLHASYVQQPLRFTQLSCEQTACLLYMAKHVLYLRCGFNVNQTHPFNWENFFQWRSELINNSDKFIDGNFSTTNNQENLAACFSYAHA